MDGTTKPDNETIYYTIDEIQTAIQEKCPISFQYFEYTQDKKKVLKHDGFTFGGCIQIEGPDSVLEEMRQMAKWIST